MNIQNKTVSVIGAVGLSFAFMLLVSLIAGVLYTPEMVYEYTEKTATGLTYGPLVPNSGVLFVQQERYKIRGFLWSICC